MHLLDFLFPKYCVNCRKGGSYLCDECFAKLSFDDRKRCLVCGRVSFNSLTHPVCKNRYTINGIFVGLFYNKIAKKLIYQFKYKPYLSDLQHFLSGLLYEALIQQEQFVNILLQKPVLVPIPLSSAKLRKRGYNQAELLAKQLGEKFSLQVFTMLTRKQDTKPQFGLTSGERIKNIKNVFILKNEYKKSSQPIILVDDVVTTGATLLEAANVLKRNGFKKVWAVALAQD